MPSRILREGILSSDRVDRLDAPAEVFYRRLMSVVDDYGRFDARPSLLRTSCYPLRVDDVREADISRWMAACQKAGLIALYAVAGKQYLELIDFKQAVRAKHSKYPSMADATQMISACDADATQMLSSAPVVEFGVVGEDGDERARQHKPNGRTPKRKAVPLPSGFAISDRVAGWAKDKGHQRLAEHFEHFVGLSRAKGYTYIDWDEAFMNAIRANWAGLAGPAAGGKSTQVAL